MTVAERDAQATEQAHRQAVVATVPEIACALQDILSRRLAAYVTNVKDEKTVARWASGDGSGIRQASEQRLRVAYEIARLILDAGDTEQTVRAWFIGPNVRLDDQPPAEVVRAGQLKEALAAARAFAAASY
jgi:hypothetical protein